MKRIGAAPAPNTSARSDGWRDHAACRPADMDVFFPEGGHREVRAQADAAKAICARCPVTAECLAYALDTRQEFGIWGGLDPFERRRHTATPKRPHTGGRLRAPCGTPAAYERHKRYGEDIDDALHEQPQPHTAHHRGGSSMTYRNDDSALTVMDWFCGAGGSSQGMHSVPGVTVTRAANHWARAIESHAANFPETDHYRGDIREAPVDTWPVCDIFWASPECPQWSNARGKRRDFDTSMQAGLFGDETDEEVERSRALMEEVPMYLRGVQERGGLVKAGVVENVVDVRAWDQWDRWLGEIRKLGYMTRTIAMNSMHADPRSVHRAPQSRDRLYVAYWHESLARTPDWDKWLRPRAWCGDCDTWVQAVQVFKKRGADMGRYRQQYVYRCPRVTCRNQVVEPEVLPAAVAIDWSLPGQRIGDRDRPLADKTLKRIQAGLDKFARPINLEAAGNTFERKPGVPTWPVDAPLTTQTTTATKAVAYDPFMVPAGGTWRDDPTSVAEPMPCRTTRENDGIAIPPLLIPVEGRDGKEPGTANVPLRTQTARNETGLAWLPFIAELRGGSSDARSVSDALATVTASGNHHGLVAPAMVMRNNGSKGDGGEHCTSATDPLRTLTTAGHQSLVTWDHLLVPYYGNGTARTIAEPIGTLATRDRYALVKGDVDIDDVLFRMLEPHEIGRAMSFADEYIVLGSKRERVRQYGNAVTCNVAEVLVCALVEAITGEELERHAAKPELGVAA